MRSLFLPAIALMNRLSYTRKFALLWLMFLVAIVVVVSSLYASLAKEIHNSQRELEGIGLATPISRTVQFLQQHRGLSAGIIGGNSEMRDLRAAKEKDVADTFAALAETLPQNLRASADWLSIEASWARLRQEGLRWAADENFAAHTRLIDQLLFFKVTVSGEYVLPLDPEIDTSYLIDAALNRLPLVLEHLAQVRAFGTVILAKRQASESERVKMNTLIAQLGEEIRFFKIDLDKVGRYNPALQTPLSRAAKDVTGVAQQIVDLVKQEIMLGDFSVAPGVFFTITTEAIDKGYTQMHQSLLPMVQSLIEARVADAQAALRTSIGVAVLLFLASVYLSIGFYYATVGSIRSLARSARAFAGGAIGERVDLGVRDELNQVGHSFNEMADGFSALLATREEDGARLHAVIETSMDAVVQMDTEGAITGWNKQALAMFGWTRQEAVGRLLHETIIPARYREAHIHGMELFMASGKGPALNSRIEVHGLHRDGHEFPVELSITCMRTGGKYEFNGFIRDITSEKASEALIWKQANFDTLTGLPNRNMFYDRLDQEIKKAARAGLTMALLFIDLDRFKDVNDTLGHNMGDILLVEAARRIGGCTRDADTVARLGGDEFIVLLSEIDNAKDCGRVAESILRKLAEPFQLMGQTVRVSASIGIALYPDDATEIANLLQDADQAMYIAKKTGRNRMSYFTSQLQEAAQTRQQLINDLYDALAADQFRVYYQPIADLRTGRIHKAEALLRWQHPRRGLVSPAEFIPLAEEIGLIVDIGDWVFREATRRAKRCRAMCDPGFQISINCSPVQFHALGGPCKAWSTHLRNLELSGEAVVIEITEGLLLDAEAGVIDQLFEFHQSGIQISLDDFGTGYSSLSYLKKFDIDYLKIDQSFVRHLAVGSDDLALSEAIIVMAHKLGLEVIAEGVETEAQRQLLTCAGCDYAQGYLFSPPLPAGEFEALLARAREGGDAG